MFVGPAGDGQRIKLVNSALFVAQVGLAVDAVRLAGSMGITEEQILAAVQHGSGGSRALSAVAWIGASAVGTRLAELMSKDVSVVRAVALRGKRQGRSCLDEGDARDRPMTSLISCMVHD